MTDGPKFVKGMTNQQLINALNSLPPSAPVKVENLAADGFITHAGFDGETVVLSSFHE